MANEVKGDLAIFCVANCSAGGMQRILVSPNDAIAICPNCRRRYGVATRTIDKIESERLSNGRQSYTLEVSDQYGGRRRRSFETHEGLKLRPGALVSFVKRGALLVGLSDHSRHLWFTIPPAPSPLRKAAKFLDFMTAVILICVALQLMRFIPGLESYINEQGNGALLLLAIPALLLLGPWIANRFQTHVSKEKEEQTPQGPPPLKLPDLD